MLCILVVVKTLNLEISRCHLADFVKELYLSACCTCSTIIFLHSTNQIIVFWRHRCRCLRHCLRSVIMRPHPLLHYRLCHARMTLNRTEITVITATGWWYGNLVPGAFLLRGVGSLSSVEKNPGNEVRDTAVRMQRWWPHHGASPSLPCFIKFSTSDNAILAFSLVPWILYLCLTLYGDEHGKCRSA